MVSAIAVAAKNGGLHDRLGDRGSQWRAVRSGPTSHLIGLDVAGAIHDDVSEAADRKWRRFRPSGPRFHHLVESRNRRGAPKIEMLSV